MMITTIQRLKTKMKRDLSKMSWIRSSSFPSSPPTGSPGLTCAEI